MLLQYYHTLRHLKPIQWRYRIYYTIRNHWRKWTGFRYPKERIPSQIVDLKMVSSIQRPSMWQPEHNRFEWLNMPHTFGEKINWRCAQYGKLWTYNLHYFEYLTCSGVQTDAAVALMADFVGQLPQTPEANEPYPVSLRLLFWIRFFSANPVKNGLLDRALYAQAYALLDQQELHLLGNHYLENGFGLLFAAYRYKDKKLYDPAANILKRELKEQILPDGGHFERSPMYHQIILYRLLDAINLTQNNPGIFDDELKALLKIKAELMLGWLQQMTFANGDIPLFNDATFGIAPTTGELMEYAARLHITPVIVPLKESGYRKMEQAGYQLMADIGPVGPDYIPGHAHSDTLGFELHINGQPFLVDTGTSTYEKNQRRQLERSTFAHNTVMINAVEQTEVWGGFRVARRAYPLVTEEEPLQLSASHTGYDALNMRHYRLFSALKEHLQINDELRPFERLSLPSALTKASFHFHPEVVFVNRGSDFIETATAKIVFKGLDNLEIMEYDYAPQFNLLVKAKKAVVTFQTELCTIISIK